MFSKYFDSHNLPSVPSQFSKWCTSIFFFIQEFILDTYSVMYRMNLFFFILHLQYLLKYSRWIHPTLNYFRYMQQRKRQPKQQIEVNSHSSLRGFAAIHPKDTVSIKNVLHPKENPILLGKQYKEPAFPYPWIFWSSSSSSSSPSSAEMSSSSHRSSSLKIATWSSSSL